MRTQVLGHGAASVIELSVFIFDSRKVSKHLNVDLLLDVNNPLSPKGVL